MYNLVTATKPSLYTTQTTKLTSRPRLGFVCIILFSFLFFFIRLHSSVVSYYYFYGLLRDFCKRAFALVLCVYKCANVCVCVYRLLRLSMLMSFNFEMQISLGQRRIVGFDLSSRLELELIRIKFTNEPPICIMLVIKLSHMRFLSPGIDIAICLRLPTPRPPRCRGTLSGFTFT